MNKRMPYLLTVDQSVQLTPNMRRIEFVGDDLKRFPEVQSGSYIKLLFNGYGEALTAPSTENQKVVMRTYTVREFDPVNLRLVVDFALHGDTVESGPASYWAKQATKGEQILVAGPGASKALASDYDWVLFMGDMTSLPAISNYLEELPTVTQGFVVIEVATKDDIQTLDLPDNMRIIWRIKEYGEDLPSALSAIEWLEGTPAVWVACEFSSMRTLRSILGSEYQVPRQQLYISSYWRQGRSEDQHKIDKRADQEAHQAQQ
ncbi:siderophore-interacting protein [Glaciecola sp. 1036]|uniref:siderophore-interacting protein n=1 Tax=Alteromonadaceae TaxID=72275 RepID=UPI003D001F81